MLAGHANVFRRGCANVDDLNEDEYVEFEYLVAATMSQIYSAFVQYHRKLVPESVWEAYCADWVIWRDKDGFNQTWHRIQASYPSEFRLALEALNRA